MAKVIISLSDKLLKMIDDYCEKYEYNRSEFIRHSVREVLKQHDNTNGSKKTD